MDRYQLEKHYLDKRKVIFSEAKCMIKIFRGAGVVIPSKPLPLRTTFAFTHPLFYDVFGKIP